MAEDQELPGLSVGPCLCPVGLRGSGSTFGRGLTVRQGLLRLAAFPGVCIFMLIGSLRCVCC